MFKIVISSKINTVYSGIKMPARKKNGVSVWVLGNVFRLQNKQNQNIQQRV